jgi:hypothetical protein
MGGEHDPKAGMPNYSDDAPFKRLSKDELPSHIAKTLAR